MPIILEQVTQYGNDNYKFSWFDVGKWKICSLYGRNHRITWDLNKFDFVKAYDSPEQYVVRLYVVRVNAICSKA